MKLLIGILVLLIITLAKAAEESDKCSFQANICYSPSKVRECLNLFPLDEEQKELTISQLRKAFQIHPLTDVLSKVGVNIFNNIRKIEKKKYENAFDFHADIFLDITQNIPDFSTGYVPPTGFSGFRLTKPFVFTPMGNTKRFKISSIDSRLNLPKDLIGKEVTSINEVSVSEYLTNQFFFNGQDAQQFTYNYITQPFGARLVYSKYPKDKSTVTFADGTSLEIDTCIFRRIATNFTDIVAANKPVAPATSNKRRESNQERCISKLGLCNEEPLSFTDVKVGKRDQKEGEPVLVEFESSEQNYAQRGIVQQSGKKLPFLRIVSLDRTDKTWKKVVLNFAKQLSKRKAPLAIIDLTQNNFGGDICETEWIINLLSQTNTQPFQKDTYKSKTYRTLYDARVSNKIGRQLFSSKFSSSVVDPTSGLLFEDSFCLSEKLSKVNRNKSKQLFTPRFFQDQCKDFLQSFKFQTKFIILTSANCGGVCSLFQSVLRKTGVAKIVGVGGLEGKPLAVNFAYHGGQAFDWNADIVPLFSLNNGIRSLPTSAAFTISGIQAYLSDSKIPEAVNSLYADEVIGWDKYTLPVADPNGVVPPPAIDLYVLASKIDPTVEKVELPTFQPKGKCYSEKN